ncbi:DUF4365 domain-containing protein [Phototrophicus methaneseepsis]|uniref:DUF4365 domain-containing protein n=1 Tax=Phototrophicus methaneseepsis TaxID=2710758 RepID=A0A7S8IE15_9CHLR|nr:DUF4365 domain-containing protein [Phototrophicus methaneseepsis]QPC82126.1 DUF4365 domain-containing protein [Phototrophicus methaneseepsis]
MALKKFFKECNISTLDDVFSKYEYGQDWRVEIVIGTDVQSAEFRIQSKVFTSTKKVEGRRLSQNIKINTLTYLAELSVPVMLHYHDHVNDKSYWMWLDEWYEKNYAPIWEKQKTKKVSIIKQGHELDSKAAAKIIQHVMNYHKRSLMLKRVSLANDTNDHFNFRYSTSGTGYSIDVFEKYPGAIQDSPVQGELKLTSEAEAILKRGFERGESVTFLGNLNLTGLPEWFTSTLNNLNTIEIKAFFAVPGDTIPLELEYLNKDDQCIFSTFAIFKYKHKGTHFMEMEGLSKKYPIKINITIDQQKPESNINIEYSHPNGYRPAELLEYDEILSKLITIGKLRITNKDSEEIYVIEEFTVTPKPLFTDDRMRQLVVNLDEINTAFDLDIKIPERTISADEENIINVFSDALREGHTNLLWPLPFTDTDHVLIVDKDRNTYKDFIKHIEAHGYSLIPPQSIIVKIFDQEITVQAGLLVYPTEIVNMDEIESSLSTDAETILIAFKFDQSKSEVFFPDFLEDELKRIP